MSSSDVAAQMPKPPAELRRATSSLEVPEAKRALFPSILLIGCVLLGAAFGAWLLTFATSLPNDLARTGVLLRALHAPGLSPGAVVLGNSVIMSGVDTQIVQERTHAAGGILNLSSAGQTLADSALYYQELPPSVTTIVQAVPLYTLVFSGQGPVFNSHVANMFNLDGYCPDDETKRLLTAAVGESEMRPLLAGHLAAVVDSRWLVRGSIDIAMRTAVRDDLSAKRALYDLYYPQPFTRPVEHDKLVKRLENDAFPAACGECSSRADILALIAALQATSAKHGRRLVVLIPPVHPALQNLYSAAYSRLKRDIQAGLFGRPGNVIDAFQLLPAQDFNDSEHPTREGAEKLSNFIADRLGPLH